MTMLASAEGPSDAATRIRDLIDYPTAAPAGIPREAAEAVYGLLNGYLRGKLPEPVPDDLMAVGLSETLRYADLLSEYKTVRVTGGEVAPGGLRMFSGWLLHERLILDRYRQTTG